MTGQSVVQTDGMARAKPAARVYGACHKTRPLDADAVRAWCQRVLAAGRGRGRPGLAAPGPLESPRRGSR
jgi:hypothetical protein